MSNKYVALVPQWVDEAIKRNNLNSSDLLNFDKVAQFLSLEDIASLVVLEEKSKLFLGIDIRESKLLWVGYWMSKTVQNPRLEKLMRDAETLALTDSFQQSVLERLSSKHGSTSEETGQKETFEVSLLGDEGVKAVLKQGHSPSDRAAESINLFRACFKLLYVYEEYHSLMSRTMGKAYLETLLR